MPLINGRHTSLDKHVKINIKWIEHIVEVKKIILGFSEACRHKYPPGHIRFKSDVEGGIKVNAYSGKGVTDIFIKIEPITAREAVKQKIALRFNINKT